MAMIHDCIPCQYGHHEWHQPVPGPVPEGVLGGWVCECRGDCAERNLPLPQSVEAPPLTPEQEADWAEFKRLIEACGDDT